MVRSIERPDAPRLAIPADELEISVEMFRLGPFADPLREPSRGQVCPQLLVMNNAPQSQKQFTIRAIANSASAQHTGFQQGSARLVDDNRSAHREGLEDDIAESLGKQRRDHHGPGPTEQPGKGRPAQQALEVHVGQIGSQRSERWLERARPGDPQVDLGKVPHHRNQPLESLHGHQPSGGCKIRPLAGLGLLVLDSA